MVGIQLCDPGAAIKPDESLIKIQYVHWNLSIRNTVVLSLNILVPGCKTPQDT
jgi:hypothetical protein